MSIVLRKKYNYYNGDNNLMFLKEENDMYDFKGRGQELNELLDKMVETTLKPAYDQMLEIGTQADIAAAECSLKTIDLAGSLLNDAADLYDRLDKFLTDQGY